jgi:hypothetical protein
MGGKIREEIKRVDGLELPTNPTEGAVAYQPISKYSVEHPTKTTGSTRVISTPDYSKYTDASQLTSHLNKVNAQNAVKNQPKFSYSYQTQLNDVIEQILGRQKFSYDLNADALYNQYKDKYIQQGQMAMMDTMGQAQAMTGGYANSYAQTAGQQAYQAHLQELNDIVPELYQMALDRYNAEGNDLLTKYGLLMDDYNRQYGEHMDEYKKLLTERDYADNEYYNSNKYNTDMYNSILKSLGYTDEQIASGELEPTTSWLEEKRADIGAKLEAQGFENEEDALAWINDHYGSIDGMEPEEAEAYKKMLTELVGSMNYMPSLTERNWNVKNDGGLNLLGINRNAVVTDGYGNEYSLAELRRELAKTMSWKEANAFIKKLQEEKGIKGAAWQ